MSNISNIIQAARNSDMVGFQKNVQAELFNRISTAIDARRPIVVGKMFNTSTNESFDEGAFEQMLESYTDEQLEEMLLDETTLKHAVSRGVHYGAQTTGGIEGAAVGAVVGAAHHLVKKVFAKRKEKKKGAA